MPLAGLRVSDRMTVDVVTVTPDVDIVVAVEKMNAADVSGLVVVDANGTPVGMLSERDCIEAATAAEYHGELGGPVADFMSSPVETVTPDMGLVGVAEKMTQSSYRRFPVVDGGRLVGVISRRDVMRALSTAAHK